MSVGNFIDALASGDKLGAEEAFGAEMQSRMADALDAKRMEIGQSIYGGTDTIEIEEE